MRILLVVISVFVALISAEFITSALNLAPRDVPYWRTNPRLSSMHHKAEDFEADYTTNMQGLRGAAIGKKTKPRIVVIGDSYTFGWGVNDDQSFPTQLQKRLGDAEVINFGVPGTNPINFYKYALHYVPQLQPDIVLVSIFKVRNTYLSGQVESSGGMAALMRGVEQWAAKPDSPEQDFDRTFMSKFALGRLIYRAAHRIDWQTYNVDWPGPAHTVIAKSAPDDLYMASSSEPPSEALLDTMKNWTLQDARTRANREDELEATFSITQMMQKALPQAKFAMLIFPVGWQFFDYPDDDPRKQIAGSTVMDEKIFSICRARQLVCVDGMNELRAFAKGHPRPDIFFKDSHFTAATNAVFANIAFDAVKALSGQ